jgi:hypothetical protein
MTWSNQSHFPGFFLSPESHRIGFCESYIIENIDHHIFYCCDDIDNCWVDSSPRDNWMLLLTSLLLLTSSLLLTFAERVKSYVLLWDRGLAYSCLR